MTHQIHSLNLTDKRILAWIEIADLKPVQMKPSDLGKKITGLSPYKNALQQNILISYIATPIGSIRVAATENGLCLLEFDSDMNEQDIVMLKKRLGGNVVQGENDHVRQAKQELAEYFAGIRQNFDVSLDPEGTDFQLRVWKSLQQISYGTTITYMEQALCLGDVKAIRAVASANGKNKIAIIIPCHRVIGSNGKLTGYAGGMERKRWLLDLERKHSQSQSEFTLF
jgi:AraC family transcriptional regulator, regulatory protein of adaptative response / methylated-DNA-[protein]-cysteine methyltransferase